jgi:translation initiation factor IF-2
MLVPHGIQVEDRGGDVQAIPISALNGTNLDTLSDAIVLQAELMDLKGDPRDKVEGVVVESRTDPQRGYGYFYMFNFHTHKSISSMHFAWVIPGVLISS